MKRIGMILLSGLLAVGAIACTNSASVEVSIVPEELALPTELVETTVDLQPVAATEAPTAMPTEEPTATPKPEPTATPEPETEAATARVNDAGAIARLLELNEVVSVAE